MRRQPIPTEFNVGFAFADARDGWTEWGYVTHDGGRTWARTRSASGANSVAIAGGQVWAIGDPCPDADCNPVVLRGAASGNVLVPTSGQPIRGFYAGQVIAATENTAYVDAFALRGEVRFATQDGGRHWRALAEPCPSGYFTEHFLTASGPNVLWQVCEAGRHVPGSPHLKPYPGVGHFIVTRSLDGGRTWRAAGSTPRGGLFIKPVSSRVVWGSDLDWLYRSTDGGRTWNRAFTPASVSFRGASSPPNLEEFDTSGPTDAQAVLAVPVHTGTQIVVAYTDDGGRHWRPQVLPLPHG